MCGHIWSFGFSNIDYLLGSVSAGYQNFLICVEMLMAAIALRYAFPISVYLNEACVSQDGGVGRTVTMQSISSSLKVFEVVLAEVVVSSCCC